jgi:hypothetical protein
VLYLLLVVGDFIFTYIEDSRNCKGRLPST